MILSFSTKHELILNRQFQCSLYYLRQSQSCGAVNCILHPVLKNQHVRIHSESIWTRTTNSKADDTHKIPLVIARTDQRSSTVSLAWINSSLRETCTAHAFRNFNSEVAVCPPTSVTLDKRNLGLLQNLKDMPWIFITIVNLRLKIKLRENISHDNWHLNFFLPKQQTN